MKEKLLNLGPIFLVFVLIGLFWLLIVSVFNEGGGITRKQRYSGNEAIIYTKDLQRIKNFYEGMSDSVFTARDRYENTLVVTIGKLRLVYKADTIKSYDSLSAGINVLNDTTSILKDPDGNVFNIGN